MKKHMLDFVKSLALWVVAVPVALLVYLALLLNSLRATAPYAAVGGGVERGASA